MGGLFGSLRKVLSSQPEAIDREKYSAVGADLDDEAVVSPAARERLGRKISLSITTLFLSITISLALGVAATLCIQRLIHALSHNRTEHTPAAGSGHGVIASHGSSSSLAQSAAQSILVAPCGSTPAEARAAGCHFDIISWTWLAEPCYDAGLSEAFAAETQDGDWFVDEARTQPLTRDQVLSGEYTGIYVRIGYHLRHCTAMWKKMHRALLDEAGVEVGSGEATRRGEGAGSSKGLTAMDAYIWSYQHTLHCEEMLLGEWSDTDGILATEVRTKYPDCGIALP